LEAVSHPVSENPDKTIFEDSDRPQVKAEHPYIASQPNEPSLQEPYVTKLLRRMSFGKI
jgi:hypothetical protein